MTGMDFCAVCNADMDITHVYDGGAAVECAACGAFNYVDSDESGPFVSGVVMCPSCGGSIQDETDEGAPLCACGWEGKAP